MLIVSNLGRWLNVASAITNILVKNRLLTESRVPIIKVWSFLTNRETRQSVGDYVRAVSSATR